MTATRAPDAVASIAAVSPAIPLPMTTTSNSVWLMRLMIVN
jgi:hypothetical protein